MNSSYTRSASKIFNDSVTSGSTYNISGNSSEVPFVFNFTSAIANFTTTSTLANHLSSFAVTTDGSTAPASGEDYLLIAGDGTDSQIYLWEDTGNGSVASGELTILAKLNSVSNSSITNSDVSFTTLSI